MPEPSRLVLLEQLQTVVPGTKVRLLGCVHNYNGEAAQLLLKDQYPASDRNAPHAIVNVNNILENANHELLEVGAWLNVLGYVEKQPDSVDPKATVRPNTDRRTASHSVHVTATMIWPAGAIKLDRYESAARDYQGPLNSG